MGIIYQTDKRSGITYAYSNEAKWNPEKKRSESKRRLLGRVVDMETKEYVPTDGRCRKLSPDAPEEERNAGKRDGRPAAKRMTKAQCLEEIARLEEENESLRKKLARLEKRGQ